MSVQRCMAETTSSEFRDWQRFLREEQEHPTREEYYLAQIAAEVRRGYSAKPNRIDLQAFILKFTNSARKAVPSDIKARTVASKSFWSAIAQGVGLRKKKARPDERPVP